MCPEWKSTVSSIPSTDVFPFDLGSAYEVQTTITVVSGLCYNKVEPRQHGKSQSSTQGLFLIKNMFINLCTARLNHVVNQTTTNIFKPR